MAGLFDLLKTWLDDETLDAEDLNAEFENIQANSIASEIEGYSSLNNVPNNELMDTTLAPYPNEVRNYATSVADEIAELRYQIQAMLGSNASEWYDAPISDLTQLSSSVAGFLPTSQNAVLSGPTNANGQPAHLVPSGTTNALTLFCSGAEPLTVKINGQTYSFTTPITITGLQLAPSSGNTGLVDTDSFGIAFAANKTAGESWIGLADPSSLQYQEYIPLNTVGANISSKEGRLIAFVMNGEYSIGTPQPGFLGKATTIITTNATTGVLMTGCKRGYFFDSSGNLLSRVGMATADTFTLLTMTYVFLRSSGSLNITYNPPTVSGVAPTSPSQGDYWYDTINVTWKIYAGSAWVVDNSIFVGSCCQNTTATMGARPADFLAAYSDSNSCELLNNLDSSAQIVGSRGSRISVYGKQVYFESCSPLWDITANLVAGVTLTNGLQLFLYMDQNGVPYIDKVQPYNRQDLAGYYHPANPWRCLGTASTDGTNFNSDCFDYIIAPYKKNRSIRFVIGGSGPTVGSNYYGLVMKYFNRGKRLRVSLENPDLKFLVTTGYPSAAYFSFGVAIGYITQAQANASASPRFVDCPPALFAATGANVYNSNGGGLPALIPFGYCGGQGVVPDNALGEFNPGVGDVLLQLNIISPTLPSGMSMSTQTSVIRVEEVG
jgi:hypothetical protein